MAGTDRTSLYTPTVAGFRARHALVTSSTVGQPDLLRVPMGANSWAIRVADAAKPVWIQAEGLSFNPANLASFLGSTIAFTNGLEISTGFYEAVMCEPAAYIAVYNPSVASVVYSVVFYPGAPPSRAVA